MTSSPAHATTGVLTPARYRIEQLTEELANGEVFSWQLSPVDGVNCAAAEPGQFNMIYGFGLGEVPISVSSLPTAPLVHTLRAVGSVTRAMRQYKPGQIVGIRGPFGSCWPVDELRERPVLVIAGGIGLAPLRPVIDSLLAQAGREQAVTVLYGARDPQTLLYSGDLARWDSHPLGRLRVTVDRASGNWGGNVGVVTKLIHGHEFAAGNTAVLICGPEVMMRFSILALQQIGIGPSDIYVSLERHMQCALGYCGHCQFGRDFVCRTGPVFRYDQIASRFSVDEL